MHLSETFEHGCLQNSANGIALKTKDDMLRLDAMVMTVQLGIRKLLARL